MKNPIVMIVLSAALCVTLLMAQRVYAAHRTLYVAICTEAAEHGGHEVAVGPQRATYQEATQDAKAHEQSSRGHRCRIGHN